MQRCMEQDVKPRHKISAMGIMFSIEFALAF